MPDLICRFVTQRGFVSRAIRAVTYSEFSHAEIGLEDGTWLGAHADGGVAIRPADYLTPTFERVYALPMTQERYDAAIAFAKLKIGTEYNFSDILGLLLHAPFTAPHRLICSQFVFDILTEAGMKPLNVLSGFDWRVTPDSLHLSPIFIGRCIRQTRKPQ